MKTILFPTDFSEVSDHAVDFALGLAQVMEARIILLHISPLIHKEPDENDTKTIYKKLLNVHDLLITQHQTKFNIKPLPVIKLEIKYGRVDETILQTAKAEDADLIIMGDKTVSSIAGRLIAVVSGTHTSHIALQASCPVLFIPSTADYKPINHILYAAELNGKDDEFLYKALIFKNMLNAEMEVMHIEERPEVELFENEELYELEEEFKDHKNIKFRNIARSDVIQGLKSYVEMHHPDMLVITNLNRDYPENIYHKSVTEQFVFDTNIPLLILHQS